MNENISINESVLSELREYTKSHVDDKRFAHILSVERKACEIGELYLPDRINELRVAAILHDLTKNCSAEENISICKQYGVENYLMIPSAVLHSVTAPFVILRDLSEKYPFVKNPEILGAVRWHATGHWGMTLFESVIYLADYIEDLRTYDDCVAVRDYYVTRSSDAADKYLHLYKTLVISFDYTTEALIKNDGFLDSNSTDARNYYLNLIKNAEKGQSYL